MVEGEQLPSEALVRVFNFLPIKQRCRLACVSKSWHQAASVDAVSVKLKEQHVPSYLHVALPDGAAQLQAAACPLMSLARSADLTWASAATGQLLESMPSLERLAFTSMASGPIAGDLLEPSGLQSLKSLTNLQSLQLNISSAEPLLDAMPSAPRTLREIELHLTGENWKTSVLDKIAMHLGAQATQLCSLSLRCSHAAVYSSTEPLEHLSRLTALTSLRMGPNPEDIFPHSSPLGFPRLPSFLASMKNLQFVDISVADSPSSASLPGINFEPIRHVPQVKLTLRADTSIRAISQLPASIASLSGLTSLTVRAFTFEDPGGWCTHAYFDLGPLASCLKLRHLDLQLGTWECEHCEVFELPGLSGLSQLHSLKLAAASRFISLGQAAADGSSGVQEVLLALPAMKAAAAEVHVTSSMRVVLRNSKVLAKACSQGVLAHSILLEEPVPPRQPTAAAAAPAAPGSQQQQQQDGDDDDVTPGRDQTTPRRPAAPPQVPPHLQQQQQQQQQYVRAPAHVVISALPNLWPGMAVWQYPMKVPGLSCWKEVHPELLCKAVVRDSMQQQLQEVLVTAAAAGCVDDLVYEDQNSGASRGLRLLW